MKKQRYLFLAVFVALIVSARPVAALARGGLTPPLHRGLIPPR